MIFVCVKVLSSISFGFNRAGPNDLVEKITSRKESQRKKLADNAQAVEFGKYSISEVSTGKDDAKHVYMGSVLQGHTC